MSWVAVGTTGATLAASYFGRQKAPGTVPYTPVDLSQEQKKSIEGNLTNESSIEALLSRGNKFNQKESLDLMEQAMPGYGALSSRLTGLAGDLATNPYDLPKDVQDNLTRKAAEMGVSTGRSGQAGDFSLLRDLGVNELQYGQSRINQAGSLTALLAGIAPKVSPMSPMSFYINPNTQATLTQQNNNGTRDVLQGGNNANTSAENYNNANNWQNLANILALFNGKNGTGGKSDFTSSDVDGGSGTR